MTQADLLLKVENVDSHLALADLSAKDVTALINQFADIVEAASPPDDGDHRPGVSLAGLSERSIGIPLRLSGWCRVGAAAVLTAHSTGDYSKLPMVAHEKLAAFSRQLISQGRFALLSNGVDEVEISASKPVPEIRPKKMKHSTTLYGKVVHAGGIRSYRATLVLSKNGKVIDIHVCSADLAKDLAARMFEVVGVKGVAWTDMRTGAMTDFRAESLTRYRGKDADPVKALDKIAIDFPEAWAGVDVPAYVAAMRDDEDS